MNPFIAGDPVSVKNFLGRQKEIRRLVQQLVNQGQSSALVGEPKMGKTSILHFLKSDEKRGELFGDTDQNFIFSYLDASMLRNHKPSDFWEFALSALRAKQGIPSEITAAYKTCKTEHFGTFVLERLFSRLKDANIRLILLIDEFDMLLDEPNLHKAEFYGGLRTLASRYSSLSLIIASRQSVSQLNQRTLEFSRSGSPFFNTLDVIHLTPFTEKIANQLFDCAKDRFTPIDRKFLVRLAGGHPFLLQTGASVLWDAYEDGVESDSVRYIQVGNELIAKAEATLKDTWRSWAPEMKKAFVIVALDNIPTILGEKQFDINHLIQTLPSYMPELRTLRQSGFIESDDKSVSGYTIQAEVMLWWLAEELVVAIRQNDELGQWLREQEWEGQLKHGEKVQLIKTVNILMNLLKGGVEIFIQTAAAGFAKVASGS